MIEWLIPYRTEAVSHLDQISPMSESYGSHKSRISGKKKLDYKFFWSSRSRLITMENDTDEIFEPISASWRRLETKEPSSEQVFTAFLTIFFIEFR